MIEQYLNYCQARNLSPETIKWYSHKLRMSGERLSVPWEDVTYDHMVAFFGYLQRCHMTDETRQGYWRALHAFFEWMRRQRLIVVNPLMDLPKPKTGVKIIDVVLQDDFRALLDFWGSSSVSSPFIRARNQAILITFYDTGIRETELIKLRVSDCDFKMQTLHVRGKGHRNRVIPFGDRTRLYLETYFHHRNGAPGLFINRSDGALSKSTIWEMMQTACDGAGVRRRKVHALRHSFGCNYLDNGGNEVDLMYLMGHSSLTMVHHYTQWTQQQRALKSFARFSPADRL